MQRGKKRNVGAAAAKQRSDQPIWQIGLKGLVLAWLVTLAGLFLTAALIYWEWVGAGITSAAAKGIMIASMLIGGLYIFKKTKGRDRIWILIMLIGYLLVRFLLSLILTFL